MKIEVLEVALICIIVCIQLYVFNKTYKLIREFKNIIPDVRDLEVTKLHIPKPVLQHSSPSIILEDIGLYTGDTGSDRIDMDDNSLAFSGRFKDADTIQKVEVNIINSSTTDVGNNPVFNRILFSVNNYLIRNRNAATDFNLIKDVVERNTDAVEEDINSSIGIPLYLGLMGTMMGIVIALFNMPHLGDAIKLDDGIGLLIGGVKIAMIASFVGLLLTIINSGWIYKGSKSYSESQKNEFYTFLQIELLPIINQGLGSTFESLQRNLLQFNDEFSTNLKGLSGVFDSSRTAIREQKELIDALDKAKVSEMTRYNVAVLKQLDVSVSQFEKFNGYLTNVTQFVENSQHLVNRTNEILERTDNFKSIADNLENKLNQSKLLMEFLSGHFNKLEEHKSFTSNAVADVGFAIADTFKELKEHIQNSSEAVKNFTIDETEALKAALSSSKSNLINLEHLQVLKSDVSQFKNSAASQGEKLKQAIDDLNGNMARSIAVLEQIEKGNSRLQSKGFKAFIQGFFKSKKQTL